uniref:helix-turn-helix domain-containing protein n=1 Tax=Amycolatopsis sp. CA-096443 TaxID=3239919 RepID=UPI003F49744F
MGGRRIGLRRARKAQDLTQEQVAEELGVGEKAVRSWEAGRSEPRPARRPRYAELLCVSQTELEMLLREGTAASARLPVFVEGRLAELAFDGTNVSASAVGRLVPAVGSQCGEMTSPAVVAAEGDAVSPLGRRSLLRNGLPAAALSALGIDDVEHVARALKNPRKFMDNSVTDDLRRHLQRCKSDDGERGPAETFPMVISLLNIVDRLADEAGSADQRDLLQLGSESAEFAGWLCRDRRKMDASLYWHDRAMELAQGAGDFTMQGYILLKKAQVAYDERDARRMLTLTKAVRNGPWALPQRVQAEAAQQEARADAMLGASADEIGRKLDVAWNLLDTAGPVDSSLGAHFNATLLNMQTAICYAEAGAPRRSVELYETTLKETRFSRRDYGFFLSLMANSLALSGEPDQAAKTGLVSAHRASETSSRRTQEELRRVIEVLKPWRNRPAVQELREAVPA